MTRRIVQIAAWSLPDVYDGDGFSRQQGSVGLDALCADGSVWEHCGGTWSRLPDIPQDEPPAVEPDPIAELEALGGTIQPCWIEGRWELTWFAAAFTAQEPIGEVVRLSDLRAAAARLLERVRGGAK